MWLCLLLWLAKMTHSTFILDSMVVPAIWMMAWMKKNVFVLEKSNRGSYGCRMKWRYRYLNKITHFIPSTLLFPYFLEIISIYLASILRQYSLAYSEPYQTSKMKHFVKAVMAKNSITLEILWFFDDFREGVGEGVGV